MKEKEKMEIMTEEVDVSEEKKVASAEGGTEISDEEIEKVAGGRLPRY